MLGEKPLLVPRPLPPSLPAGRDTSHTHLSLHFSHGADSRVSILGPLALCWLAGSAPACIYRGLAGGTYIRVIRTRPPEQWQRPNPGERLGPWRFLFGQREARPAFGRTSPQSCGTSPAKRKRWATIVVDS